MKRMKTHNEAYQKVQDSEFVTRLPVENGYYGSQNTIGSSSRCSPVASTEGAGYGSQGYSKLLRVMRTQSQSLRYAAEVGEEKYLRK